MIDGLFVIVIAYLLGSIPFGLLITRAAGLGDVRNIGSGNIGATNVMRTGKKGLGMATLLLDAGKGYAAVKIAVIVSTGGHFGHLELWHYAAALAAVLGHIFPVWLKFKGGKGVATALGALFALNPMLGLGYGFFWIFVILLKQYVSLASILAFWFLAFTRALNSGQDLVVFLFIIAAIITWTHRANLKRLREKTEPKIGKKKS